MSIVSDDWHNALQDQLTRAAAHRLATRPRSRRKPVLIAAAAAFATLVAGTAVAASVGAFDGLGSTTSPRNTSDAVTGAVMTEMNSQQQIAPASPIGTPFLGESRLLRPLAPGKDIYAIPTSTGKLCVALTLPATPTTAHPWVSSCGRPLDARHPATFNILSNGSEGSTIYGVARDQVASISFTLDGLPIVANVKNNVWGYHVARDISYTEISNQVATLRDGTTVSVTTP